jgi:hypothetical protein
LLSGAGRYLTTTHDTCKGDGCVLCAATRNLTAEDLWILRLYALVADQVHNIAPFGAEKPVLLPRLEAWLAVWEAYGVRLCADQQLLLEQCRALHDMLQNGRAGYELSTREPADFKDAPEPR